MTRSDAPRNGGDAEAVQVGEFRVKRVELVRLLVQSLDELGLRASARVVEEEARVKVQSPLVVEFREALLAGSWERVLAALPRLLFAEATGRERAEFLIAKEMFLERMDAGDLEAALGILRTKIAPLSAESVAAQAKELSNLLLCINRDELYQTSKWRGVAGGSRQQLLDEVSKLVSPVQFLPAARLNELLAQAIRAQRHKCVFLNSHSSFVPLLHDCTGGRNELPNTTVQVIEAHTDEVWSVAFSPSGRYLASGSKDASVRIWRTDGGAFVAHRSYKCHDNVVNFVCWNAASDLVLSCGNDKLACVLDISSDEVRTTVSHHSAIVTCGGWLPKRNEFLTGSLDHSVCLWSVGGDLLRTWHFGHVLDMAVFPDGEQFVVIGAEKEIVFCSLHSDEQDVVKSETALDSLRLSADGALLLVTRPNQQEIQLYDAHRHTLLRTFQGPKHERYVVRACIGGDEDSFVLSGSEDGQLYVWHRDHRNAISVLSGHTAVVNDVAWSPSDPHLFVSASDDCTIRVWRAVAHDTHDGGAGAEATSSTQ